MKNKSAIFLLLPLITLDLYGQDLKNRDEDELKREAKRKMKEARRDKQCDSCKVLSFSVCPTEMVYGYEDLYADYRFSKHFSAGVAGGYIFQMLAFSGFGNDDYNHPWTAYNGTLVRIHFKYFPMPESGGYYFGLQGTYKDLYYSWVEFTDAYHGSGDQSFGYTRSETASEYGMIYLLGYQSIYNKFTLDYFGGIGNRWRDRKFTIHSSYSNIYPQNLMPLGAFTQKQTLVVFIIGIKIGIKIHEKK